jgi:putative PIN family toxin of toxin-antitoxin system
VTVVFDSSIWISALEFRGLLSKAVEHAAVAEEIVICSGIEDEITEIMKEKFGREPVDTRFRLSVLLKGSWKVEITGLVLGVCRDPNDDFILECAVVSRADVIVTGDKDLLSLGEYEGIRIVTARQYLEMA